jgi:4-hydroxy-3-methylbut-2-en-1-yl diphosphate reductase
MAMAKGCLVQDFACIKVDAGQNVINAQIRKGMNVIFHGKEGHAETRGAVALIPPGRGGLVTSLEDLKKLKYDPSRPTGVHAQTTLSTHRIREVKDATSNTIPLTVIRKRGDGCEATDDRQDAVVKLREEVDAMIVVTDRSSSNGTELFVRAGEEREDGSTIPAFLIPGAEELVFDWRFPPESGIERVGITFSASTDPSDIDLVKEEAGNYGVTVSRQDSSVDEGAPYPTPRNNMHLLPIRWGLQLPYYSGE